MKLEEYSGFEVIVCLGWVDIIFSDSNNILRAGKLMVGRDMSPYG